MDTNIASILIAFAISFVTAMLAFLVVCFAAATFCVAIYALGTWTVKVLIKAYDPILATTSQ